MSNPGETDEEKNDALAALHGLGGVGDSDESEREQYDLEEDPQLRDAESREDPGASSAASGFVGMLAKEGAPSVGGGSSAGNASAAPGRSRPEAIQMARELQPDEIPAHYRPTGVSQNKRKVAKKVPGWYHGAMPVMFTMGAVLFLIGVWAVGGLIYIAANPPGEATPGYPLIQRDLNDDTTGVPTYSTWSKGGTIALSVCVPVAVAMEIMGMMMLKQINAGKRAGEK